MPQLLKSHLMEIITKLAREVSQLQLSEDQQDYLHFRTDSLCYLARKCNELYEIGDDFLNAIDDVSALSKSVVCINEAGYKAPKEETGNRGRPKYIITKQQLEYYLENGFTVPAIAKMISVAVKTVKRRLKDYELSITDSYAKLNDEELHAIIRGILTQNPNCGYRRMLGFLLSRGIRVSEQRARESMQRVDPEGVLLRAMKLTTINRREYRVPGVLSLWHIDSHHKLIRYNLCTNTK